MTVRTAPGVNGEPVILGAWCPRCRQEAMPMRDGTCGFCDTPLLDDAPTPPTPKLLPPPKPRRRTGTGHTHSRERLDTASIVTALQAAAAAKGRAPHSNEWLQVRPSRKTIYRRFGSWSAALDAAGLS